MGKTEQLWAIHEIRQLVYRYAYAVDTRDWGLMRSLWVKTSSQPEGSKLNYQTWNQVDEAFHGAGPSTLFVGNHLITLDGPDHANGDVYCQAFVHMETYFHQLIIYKDIYERHNDEWLFLERDHLLWWGETKDSPMNQDPANWPASQVGAGVAFEVIRHK